MHSFWGFLSKADVFNYIEFFYNSKPRHGTNNGISPQKLETVDFENLNTVQ
jgi:putative transposase